MSERPTGEWTKAAEAEIAAELDRVQTESYGVGANSISVTISDDSVVAILDIDLAVSEQTLLEAGKSENVKELRNGFQAAIEPTLRAIVERATGRSVSSFLSAMSIDPLYAVEVFRLEPAAAATTIAEP